MSIDIRMNLHEDLYLRDPQDTDLGKRFIRNSILLINELGFECFTFKKLAVKSDSTEASVYRYFENKRLLLLYLVSWYWEWVSYLCDINMNDIVDPKQKLKVIIRAFVAASQYNPAVEFVDESILHRIVIAEGSKTYHTKSVDQENARGFFLTYKNLVQKICDVILEIKSDFPYPHALASTLFEMTNNHIYFAEHLPRLTDVTVNKGNYAEVETMLNYFAFSLLEKK